MSSGQGWFWRALAISRMEISISDHPPGCTQCVPSAVLKSLPVLPSLPGVERVAGLREIRGQRGERVRLPGGRRKFWQSVLSLSVLLHLYTLQQLSKPGGWCGETAIEGIYQAAFLQVHRCLQAGVLEGRYVRSGMFFWIMQCATALFLTTRGWPLGEPW
jgi:hypothetical protein